MTRARIAAGICLALAGLLAGAPRADAQEGWVRMFDGRTLEGWEGSRAHFRVRDGVIVGGTRARPIARNEFLCRSEETGDFDLRLQFRLDPGVNSGVQIRSQRIPGSHETIGYQADLGDGYWGALYDESRRKRILAAPDAGRLAGVLDPTGWNDYRILAQGRRVRLFVNGQPTVDYTEPETDLEQRGRICLQIHSGPPGEVRFRDVRIRELPPGGDATR